MRTYDFDYVPASPEQGGCDLPAQQMRQENPQVEVVREEPQQEIPVCTTGKPVQLTQERMQEVSAPQQSKQSPEQPVAQVRVPAYHGAWTPPDIVFTPEQKQTRSLMSQLVKLGGIIPPSPNVEILLQMIHDLKQRKTGAKMGSTKKSKTTKDQQALESAKRRLIKLGGEVPQNATRSIVEKRIKELQGASAPRQRLSQLVAPERRKSDREHKAPKRFDARG